MFSGLFIWSILPYTHNFFAFWRNTHWVSDTFSLQVSPKFINENVQAPNMNKFCPRILSWIYIFYYNLHFKFLVTIMHIVISCGWYSPFISYTPVILGVRKHPLCNREMTLLRTFVQLIPIGYLDPKWIKKKKVLLIFLKEDVKQGKVNNIFFIILKTGCLIVL